MRVFIAALVLIFSLQSWTKAEDISDFEIEGMSIGDSLLDHFSENEIKKSLNDKLAYPASDKFSQIDPFKEFINYEHLSINIKKDDKKYIIYQIKGSIFYNNKIKKCFNKKEKIINEISAILESFKKEEYTSDFQKNAGKSKAYITEFILKDGSIRVWCTEWDKKHKTTKNWEDSLNVDVSTNEYLNWLDKEAYK